MIPLLTPSHMTATADSHLVLICTFGPSAIDPGRIDHPDLMISLRKLLSPSLLLKIIQLFL